MITKRIDKVVNMPDEYRSATPPPPHSVKVELMRNCNYRCSFCHHSELSKNTGSMPLDLYEKILRELHSLGVKEIAPFFFGESFLDVRLPHAIKLAKDIGFEYVFLTTNGSACTKIKLQECFAAGLDSLKFSFNSADKEQFAELTGCEPSLFEKVKENIKWARKIRDGKGYKCGLYASYIRFDSEQDKRMEATLADMRPYLDEVYALPLYNQAHTVTKEGWDFSGGNTGRADAPVPHLPCWTLFRAAHINYDGTVCSCSFSVNDEFIMGDLNKQTFMEIWHSEKFVALRKKHLAQDITETPCEGCVVKK